MRVSLFLDLVADTFPDKAAFIGNQRSWTFAELREGSQRLAAHLKQDCHRNVGYLGINSPLFPLTLFAASQADLTLAPMNYRLPDERLRRLAERLAPATIVADDDMCARLDGIDGIRVLPASSALEIITDTAALPPMEVSEDNPTAVLLFTSGTSGDPKAALQDHENLSSYILQTVEFLSAEDDSRALIAVPPYHIAAVSAVLSSVYSGRTVVQLDSFTAEQWLQTVAEHQVTQAMVVPTMLEQVLNLMDSQNIGLPHLRALAYGGGKMHRDTILKALRMLPQVAFTNAYGLTETSSTICLLGPDTHDAARNGDSAAIARLSSVGQPVPGIELKICDDNGKPVNAGCEGEIRVRGDQVSGRYEGRSALDSEGWFPTRDLGWMDAEGFIFLNGRMDDVIVRGGENISPGEIEDVLRQHPAVTDAAVIGEPDAHWGERIVAFVTTNGVNLDEQALRDFIKGQLRSTKVPEVFHYRSELPYNETGKLLRRVLRDELVQNLATP